MDVPSPPPIDPQGDGPLPPGPTDDERTLGLLLWGIGLFFPLVGPLIVWLLKKDESPFIDAVGKAALNFQIWYVIWSLVIGVIAVVSCGIGTLLYIPYGIVWAVFTIMGALKARDGISDYKPFGTLTPLIK